VDACRREMICWIRYGGEYSGYGRTVDTHVRRLREKLGEASDMVETVRGVGYRFRSGNI
jgi:DNA-binding response OmpR family regulator